MGHRFLGQRRFVRPLAAWAILLVLCLSTAWAAGPDDAAGEWDIKLDYQGNLIPAKIIIKNDGGALTGKWTSERGESELANIKYEGNKLSFTRTIKFQDQEFELNYEGTIEGNKLTGMFTTPMGDMSANGEKLAAAAPAPAPAEAAKAPAVAGNVQGLWELSVDSPLGVNTRKLNIDDKGVGTYETDFGKFQTRNLKLEGNKLTFDLPLEMSGQKLELKFNGTVEGETLKGSLESDAGGASVEGKRISGPAAAQAAPAAPVDEPLTGEVKLPGKWSLSMDSPDGASYTGELVVKQDGDKRIATLTTDLGEVKIENVNVDGNKIDFKTNVDFGGTAVPVNFKGSTGGDAMKGVVSLNFEGQEMNLNLTGKRTGDLEAAVAVAADVAAEGALTGDVNLPGKWALSMDSPDGASYQGELAVKQDGEKRSATLTTDLGEVKIENVNVTGNNINFTTTVDFGGTAVPVTFKGSTGGDAMKGVVSLNLEGQEMNLNLTGKRTGDLEVVAAIAADKALTGDVKLPGKWTLAMESPDGASYQGELVVKSEGDKTNAVLTTDLGEIKIDTITVKGNNVDFATNADFGGTSVPVTFKGSTGGDNLEGKVSLNFQGQEMTLPVIGKRTGDVEVASAAGDNSLNGTKWKLTATTEDGANFDGQLIVKQEGGKTSGDLSSVVGSLHLDNINIKGSDVDFSTQADFQGSQVPVAFKGKIEGEKLTGTATVTLNGTEMTVPIEGKKQVEVANVPSAAKPAEGGLTGDVKLPGNWTMSIDSPDGASYDGEMEFVDKGGKLSGTLTTELGQVVIDKVNVKGNDVDFATNIDFGGTAVPVSFKGSTGGDKLKGIVNLNFQGQEMSLPVNASRKAAAAGAASIDGTWNLVASDENGDSHDAAITFSKLDGKTVAVLTSELGEVKLEKVDISGNKVAFGVEPKADGSTLPLSFEGTIDGDALKGNVKLKIEGEEQAFKVEGKRAAPAAAAPAAPSEGVLSGEVSLPGSWTMAIASPDGASYDGEMEFKDTEGKISGTLTTELGQIVIEKVNVAGNKIDFTTNVDFGGVLVPVTFKGSTGGAEIKGQVNMNFQGQEMELPLTGKKKPANAVVILTGPVVLPGLWHLEVTTPDGATSMADMTFTEENGKLTAVLATELGEGKIDEIVVKGNEVTFKTQIDFGGTMVPMEFTGSTGGEKIQGSVKLNFEGQAMEIPITGLKAKAEAVKPAASADKPAEGAPAVASACCKKPHCGPGCKGSPNCGACCSKA